MTDNVEELSPSDLIREDFRVEAQRLIAKGVEWEDVMLALKHLASDLVDEYAPSPEIALQIHEIGIKNDIRRYSVKKDFTENYDEKVNKEFFRLLDEYGMFEGEDNPH